jgi:hypothetical protein
MFRSKFVDNFDNVRIYTRIFRVSILFIANICQSPGLNTKLLPAPPIWVYLTIARFVLKLYSTWCLLCSYFPIIRSIRWVSPYGRTIYHDATKVSRIQQYNSQHMTETVYFNLNILYYCIDNFSIIILIWFLILSSSIKPFCFFRCYVNNNSWYNRTSYCDAIRFLMWGSTQYARGQQTVESKTQSPLL